LLNHIYFQGFLKVQSRPTFVFREGWLAIFALAIIHFFYGGLLKSMTMFYPYWQIQFNVNNTQVSTIFSALSFSMQFGAFMSQYTVRFPVRKTMLVASCISFVGGVCCSMADNLYLLILSVGCVGFGLGLCRVRSISIASQGFSADKRALALAVGFMGTPIGSALLPILWRFLLNRFTVKQVLLIMSGLLAQIFIAALLPRETTTKVDKAKSTPDDWRSIYTFPMVLFMTGMFFTFSGKLCQFPYIVPFSESIGLTDYQPATILFTMNIIDIFGRPLGGFVSSTSVIRRRGQSLFLASFIGALALMNLLSGVVITDYSSFMVWSSIFGLVYAMPVSSQMSSICEFTDVKNMNSVLSLNALLVMIGVVVGPIINGMLVDFTGSYRSTFYLAGVLMAASSLFVFSAKFA